MCTRQQETCKTGQPGAHILALSVRAAMQQATTIMRDSALQRRRPVWFAAVQCILRADTAGLERALAQIENVNATINGGTLLQLALEGAFPGDLTPDAAALDRGMACIRALLDRGADANLTYSGIPPLVFALLRCVCPAVRLLIKRGAVWAPIRIAGRNFGERAQELPMRRVPAAVRDEEVRAMYAGKILLHRVPARPLAAAPRHRVVCRSIGLTLAYSLSQKKGPLRRRCSMRVGE